jgi:hypothetical protein
MFTNRASCSGLLGLCSCTLVLWELHDSRHHFTLGSLPMRGEATQNVESRFRYLLPAHLLNDTEIISKRCHVSGGHACLR